MLIEVEFDFNYFTTKLNVDVQTVGGLFVANCCIDSVVFTVRKNTFFECIYELKDHLCQTPIPKGQI